MMRTRIFSIGHFQFSIPKGLTSPATADRIRAGLFVYRGAWTVTPSQKPRYDRIVSLVLLVLIGLAVVFLIDRNPDILRARLGGDLPVITLSWALVVSLVVITATGADVFIRSHPPMQTPRL